jgi:hypothetical protein
LSLTSRSLPIDLSLPFKRSGTNLINTTQHTQDHDQEDEHKDEQEKPQDEDQDHDQEENNDQGGDKDDGDHERSRPKPSHPRVRQTIRRDHPVDNILGDIKKEVTIRSCVATFCQHYSFVSSLEPFKIEDGLRDPD